MLAHYESQEQGRVTHTPDSKPKSGSDLIILTASRLTVMTRPIRRTLYPGSSARLGSLTIPMRLSRL